MNIPAKPRIVIVDDEPVMRTITQSVLSQHNFDVITFVSAEDAIKSIVDGQVPDLLLLDVLMPGMNGFDACRVLRCMPRLTYLPIIMLTALDDQASIDEAYSCGATDFITKPLNIPLLPHRLRYLLRSAITFKDLVDSETALIHAQKIAQLGNWYMDSDGAIVAASKQCLDIFGAEQLPLTETHLLARVHREDRNILIHCRTEMRLGRPYQLDYRLRSIAEADRWRHVHERGTPQFDEQRNYRGASGFTQDISERVAQEEKIRRLAWHDPVTGLNNRDRLIELLERDMKSEGEKPGIAILFIHLSNLREVSTVLGQDIADGAIQNVSSRLKTALESPPDNTEFGAECLLDAKLARYDEQSLVITLPACLERDPIHSFAQYLHASLRTPMQILGEEMLMSPYVGISYYPNDASESAELIRRAMLVALHSANTHGSSVSFFDPKHDHEATERMILERGLRAALEQGGQLEPYFQPKISAATGEIVGAEVLLRWLHPTLGFIVPDRFIPVAEECGLIHPISEWLISRVCELVADWLAMRQDCGTISINLSASSFFQRTLIQHIDEVLERTGIPASKLIIELTESVLMQNADTAHLVIGELRNRGIRISLDDFGTGFSSLGYLNRFSIDEIKIDRSFVVNLENDHKERALVQAIITLGRALGLKVVAEGVETLIQADLLKQMGCDLFQGFLFARPMSAEHFITFRLPSISCGEAAERIQ